MKYNFKVQVPFNEAEVTALNATVPGLQVSGGLNVLAQVATNTELPDDLVEKLQASVKAVLADKFGSEVEASFVSSEH